jgi:hypothetical protein
MLTLLGRAHSHSRKMHSLSNKSHYLFSVASLTTLAAAWLASSSSRNVSVDQGIFFSAAPASFLALRGWRSTVLAERLTSATANVAVKGCDSTRSPFLGIRLLWIVMSQVSHRIVNLTNPVDYSNCTTTDSRNTFCIVSVIG